MDEEGMRTRSFSAAVAADGRGGKSRLGNRAAAATAVRAPPMASAPAAVEGGAVGGGDGDGGGVGDRVCWFPGQFVDVKGTRKSEPLCRISNLGAS